MTCCEIEGDIVDQDESCNVTAVFYDAADPAVAIAKSALLTLTCTLLDVTPGGTVGAVINSRNAQNILDANGGTVATDGTLTLRLEAADNPNVNTTLVGEVESHELTLAWTWSDGVSTRAGRSDPVIITVRPRTVPVP